MPESRSRKVKKATYTPPPKSQARPPSPKWWVFTMLGIMLAGFVWLVVYYVSKGNWPIGALGNWNMAIALALIMGGFGMTANWR